MVVRTRQTDENLMAVGMQWIGVSPMVVGTQWMGINPRTGTMRSRQQDSIKIQRTIAIPRAVGV